MTNGKEKKDDDGPVIDMLRRLKQEVEKLGVEVDEYKAKIEPGWGKADFAAALGAFSIANLGFSVLKVDETGVFVAGRQVMAFRRAQSPEQRLEVAERRFSRRTQRLEASVERVRSRLEGAERTRQHLDFSRQESQRYPQGSPGRAAWERIADSNERQLRRELAAVRQLQAQAQRAEARVRASRLRMAAVVQGIHQDEQDAESARRATVEKTRSLREEMTELRSRVTDVENALV
ncbi:hypothetical protein AQ490_18485 [Wenjunlia vitaminophila]|uniref:Uncharacterized protein n=1 Tax=Wenjunlia vitaminophila TaxID=76728 RepID=A0A0T6LUA3_WENVI|nr:hypothetical protein [Wenjunlia vitaminophila]KRV49699.1 hypothetical protein AQ490_18485 [Wenjunlia vitaminophila]